MENIIQCQRCYEWLTRNKATSIANNMRWASPITNNDGETLQAMAMQINYFCPSCISIIEINSEL